MWEGMYPIENRNKTTSLGYITTAQGSGFLSGNKNKSLMKKNFEKNSGYEKNIGNRRFGNFR